MISGMMVGAYASGRTAGRVRGARLEEIGFACSTVALLGNIAYSALAPQPALPWAVLPTVPHALGIAFAFPNATPPHLHMHPLQRGSASSLQAFTGLVLNAVLAGVVSPLVSHDPVLLAVPAAAFVLLGWGFWCWEARRGGTPPPGQAPAAELEPTGQL